jgi:hypothetical protein
MSRRSVMTPRARQMALKLEMVAEIKRLQAMAARSLAELDQLLLAEKGAKGGVVLDGRVDGDKIIVED